MRRGWTRHTPFLPTRVFAVALEGRRNERCVRRPQEVGRGLSAFAENFPKGGGFGGRLRGVQEKRLFGSKHQSVDIRRNEHFLKSPTIHKKDKLLRREERPLSAGTPRVFPTRKCLLTLWGSSLNLRRRNGPSLRPCGVGEHRDLPGPPPRRTLDRKSIAAQKRLSSEPPQVQAPVEEARRPPTAETSQTRREKTRRSPKMKPALPQRGEEEARGAAAKPRRFDSTSGGLHAFWEGRKTRRSRLFKPATKAALGGWRRSTKRGKAAKTPGDGRRKAGYVCGDSAATHRPLRMGTPWRLR